MPSICQQCGVSALGTIRPVDGVCVLPRWAFVVRCCPIAGAPVSGMSASCCRAVLFSPYMSIRQIFLAEGRS